MALGTKRLKYCDLTNYLAIGTSLQKFYTAYKVQFPKAPFPYEYLDSLKKLRATSLPKRCPELRKAMDENDEALIEKLAKKDPYFSIRKQKTVSNEEVDLCEKEWKSQDMKTFADFIK